MSYDYINDTFGEFVKTSPKYQEVEMQAIKLLKGIVEKSIAYDAIYEGFEVVRRKMVELDDNTNSPGYPLWLSKFLAFNFLKWRDWYMLQKMYAEEPEKFSTQALQARYQEIVEMRLDESFYETCKYCLNELSHKMCNLDE
jgi:hypothetical protein